MPSTTYTSSSMTTPVAISRPRWDPMLVLDVHPGSCSGITQKGLPCRQRMFSNVDINRANDVPTALAARKPRRGVTIATLEDLAYLTLCPRWHRKPGYSQVNSVVSRWKHAIAHRFPTPPPRPITNQSSVANNGVHQIPGTITQSARQLYSHARQLYSQALTVPLPLEQHIQAQQDLQLQQLQQQLDQLLEQVFALPGDHPLFEVDDGHHSDLGSDHESTDNLHTDDSADNVGHTNTDNNIDDGNDNEIDPNTDDETDTTDVSDTDSIHNSDNETSSESVHSSPEVPSTSAAIPPPYFPRRKPLDECLICYESFLEETGTLHIVHCRAQCGQNYHLDCLRPWSDHLQGKVQAIPGDPAETRRRKKDAVNCPYCRTKWQWNGESL